MAQDPPDALARQRTRRMLRDMQKGPFAVLAFPDDDADNLRIYASGLDEDKLRRIERFIESVINEE